MSTPKFNMHSSAYDYLYLSVRGLYTSALNELVSIGQMHGSNSHTRYGVTAYVLATATWESYLNFLFFSIWTKEYFGQDVRNRMHELEDSLDGLSICEKTHALPLIAFGRTLKKGDKAFQDLSAMVGIRNSIVHNYMHRAPATHLKRVFDAGIQMPRDPEVSCWLEEIATLESIRWCLELLGTLNREFITLPKYTKIDLKPRFPKFTIRNGNKLIKERFGNLPK